MPSHSRSRGYRRSRNDDGDLDDLDDPYTHRRHRSRGYDPDEYERDHDYDDAAAEGDPVFAESRPRFSRPPNARRSPGGRERSRTKAKESPATTPLKSRDRERDRDGRRRRERELVSDAEGRVRDRRERRRRDADPDREHDSERERERERRRERRRQREMERQRERELELEMEQEALRSKHTSADSANSASQLLSADALAKLNAGHDKGLYDGTRNAKPDRHRDDRARRKKKMAVLADEGGYLDPDGAERVHDTKGKTRIVSGSHLEEGRGSDLRPRKRGRGGYDDHDEKFLRGGGDGGESEISEEARKKKKKRIWIAVGVLLSLLAIIIPVAVVVSKKNGGDSSDSSSSSSSSNGTPTNKELDGLNHDSIPKSAQGTYLDPWSWYDTQDFNVTYTEETVGGLSIMGLNSTWDDSARPNDNVPPLNQNFTYGKTPIRGVNLGGWLSIEPWITPSFFNQYSASDNVVDEYTLMSKLGSSAAQTLEKHYDTFITEDDFRQIADAGLDHVRIPFSYWAVQTYDGDPYLQKTSWRYLLRGIEWARKYGIRVKLDIHGLPGSQNGWNHSGRQGPIGWLNGTDGDLNAQRSKDIHDKLSTFFAAPRYKNVVTIYGLCNEPKLLSLDVKSVIDWTTETISLARKNGLEAYIAFGDGFLELTKWNTMMKNVDDKLFLDTHQYTIFNVNQINLDHTAKVDLLCGTYVDMMKETNSASTGWGPTICGEWSQADTDCTQFINNVGVGARWTGTMNTGNASTSVLDPRCPTAETGPSCTCDEANADPSTYSDGYKKALQTYAEAQMAAWEQTYGWFYWTWETESAVQWSWKKGLAAGILPAKAYAPSYTCSDSMPSFGNLPENY